MIANIPWNIACACNGIVAEYVAFGSSPTLCRPSHSKPPNQEVPPGPKAIEYPIRTHWTLITPSATTLIIIVLSAFLGRTRPP